VTTTTVAYSFSTPEERRHTLQMGVPMGVHGQRVPGPIVLLSVLGGRVPIAVKQQSVQFADIITIYFICKCFKKNQMSTDMESWRGNKRARVTRGSRNPKHSKRKALHCAQT
jgi:hypothetical protein